MGKKVHVLQLKGDRFVLLHELEASSFSREVLEQSDGSAQKVYVPFGGANTYSDEQYKYHTLINGKWKINIRTSKHMKLEGKVGDMIRVYKKNRTVSGGATSTSYSTDHSYGFYMDENNRKPFLPGQYAKEIGLQVLFIAQ